MSGKMVRKVKVNQIKKQFMTSFFEVHIFFLKCNDSIKMSLNIYFPNNTEYITIFIIIIYYIIIYYIYNLFISLYL